MTDWLNNIEFWYWLIVALVLIVLEMLVSGGFFLWMGIAAAVVGGLLYLVPMPWLVQILIFGVISVTTLVYYKRLRRNGGKPSDQPTLNRRGEQYIGRIFNLEEPLVNGTGKVKVDDSTWKITGLDYPAGTRIKVVAVEGTVLKVEEDASHGAG